MDRIKLNEIINNALQEDIGWGDVTTESTIPKDKISSARLIAKQNGIMCGLDVFELVMATVDGNIKIDMHCSDGDYVEKGQLIASINGPSASILTAERVALNFLQRMSGIATQTAKMVELVKGTNAAIVDTRKTTPGLRMLEKYAVRIGGGHNHRFNLADGVLIKDNHIRAAGGITQAVVAAKKVVSHMIKIEVETENIQMVEEALSASADVIMLDNMDVETMTQAVKLIGGRALVEASGNMGEGNLKQVALAGVDIISIGSLTHTVTALDISLRFDY